jgi:hypothetical protein
MTAESMAITSLIISGANLTWQLIAWWIACRFGGHRVKVDLLAGAAGHGGVAAGPLKSFNADRLTSQGFKELLFVIRARNIGRLPVDLTYWSLSTRQGLAYVCTEFHRNPILPYRLESGSEVHFQVPMEHIVRFVHAARVSGFGSNAIYASVALGTGRLRRSAFHRLPRQVASQNNFGRIRAFPQIPAR